MPAEEYTSPVESTLHMRTVLVGLSFVQFILYILK
jgi:hypothetical protein